MSFEIVEQRLNGEPHLTQVTAWAGRTFCFDKVMPRIVSQLDPQDTHVIWLDNSGDKWFRGALLAHAERFSSFTLIEDCSDQFDINPHMGAPEEQRVAAHVRLAEKIYETYQACFLQLAASSLYTWVVEDDVEIPSNAFERMVGHFAECDELGTIAGRMLDRRSHEAGREETVVTDYEVTMALGRDDSAVVKAHNMHARGMSPTVPKWGTQIVGSTHMGCWLSRSALIRKPGIAPSCDGVLSCDNSWGWRIWKERRMRVAVDWSIHCRHHYLDAKGQHRVAE